MRFYYSLEILRGVGALMVMLLHFNRMVEPYAENGFSKWVEVSAMGVDYFFVLSGFLMYCIYHGKFGERSVSSGYFLRRIARIYPMFWISLIIMSALIPFSDSLNYPPPTDILKHVILLKPNIDEFGNGRILGVGWTLEIEIIFYFLFGLTLLIKGKLYRLLLAGSLLQVTLIEPYFLLFYFGILTGWLKTRDLSIFTGGKWGGVLIMILGFSLSVFSEKLLVNELFQKLGFGTGFLLLIIGAIRFEKSIKNFSDIVPRCFFLLGSASYTVYLLHIPLGTVLLKVILLGGVNLYVDAWFIVVFMTAASLLIAFFVSEKIEMPMNRFFIALIKSRESRRKVTC